MANSAASKKTEEQSMEEILNSIRKIIADDQKAMSSTVERIEKPVVKTETVVPVETSIEDDIQALRAALNAIKGEVEGMQSEAAEEFIDYTADESADSHVISEDEGLVSEQVEQSVRQSFFELTETVQQFDVEAAAQDMLRPMLKEWLDNNLSGLVERLVREEIERLSGRK
ncbi:DUF2497 domain-containing protein [Microvirga sp. W0021]|uniref:DUF2497 domain-containing protein n=1 Tax=Hohaiivirga grylli TaxID=3133970 RepID=A0ABV0BKM0_9HYPH